MVHNFLKNKTCNYFHYEKSEIMDHIDKKILSLLKENGRLTNKEIGEVVHMTGQAVGNRILKMQEEGIFKNFSVHIQYENTQFIRIFMNTNQFTKFETAVKQFEEVEHLYQVSGQACYIIIGHFTNQRLVTFINSISAWGRYTVDTVIAEK